MPKILRLSSTINATARTQLDRLSGNANHALNIDIPDRWEDFAPLTQIRSGVRVIPFTPYEYQVDVINCIESHFATVICKTRQLGLTECIANYFLWKAIKHPGYVAVVLSKGGADTNNIAKRIRVMTNTLAPLGLDFENDNLMDMRIKNGGRIVFRPSTPNGVRGLESVSDILFDEVAFVDSIEQIYTSAIPATEMVGDDARLIFISTPNGKSGFYWDKLALNNPSDIDVEKYCNDIKSGSINPVQYWTDNNDWCKFIVHWKAHPIYGNQDDYLGNIKRKKQLSDSAIEQEYNLSFNESEVIVFSNELVRLNAVGNYKQPNPELRYYFGIDVSTVGNDYTVCLVLSEHNGRFNVAHIYRKRKKSMEYNLEHILNLINEYNPIKVGIEVTGGTGQVYLEQLSKRQNSNLFEAIKTTGDTKPQMIDRLLLALEKRVLTYPPGIVSDELLAFRRVGSNLKRMEAVKGSHDDIVMALSFALTISPFNQHSKGFTFTTIPTL